MDEQKESIANHNKQDIARSQIETLQAVNRILLDCMEDPQCGFDYSEKIAENAKIISILLFLL